MIGLFSSYPCPPQFILKAYDLARCLRDSSEGIISGFQSPLEKDILDILLRGKAPIIICLARRVESYRVPVKLCNGIASGQIKIVAPELRKDQNRITLQTVAKRDALILEMSSQLLVIYARPGGKNEALADRSIQQGKSVQAIDDPANNHLFALGASRLKV